MVRPAQHLEAMLRSWENRPDTKVVDEPLYAYYLHETGLSHPGRDDVIASARRRGRRSSPT